MKQQLVKWYFDHIYNPVYDFGIARTKPYQRLQSYCLDKLTFHNNDHILCIGVGTGNEIVKILEREQVISITGIDTSRKALDRANKKALNQNKKIITIEMDAHKIDFPNEIFDKVLCLHVMGFLQDDKIATQEIARVLKKGGQFVITYPSGIGSIKLAGEIFNDICIEFRSMRLINAIKMWIESTTGSIAYLPVSAFVKPANGFYSKQNLTAMLNTIGFSNYAIYEDTRYQDYIVWGKK